MPCPMVAAVDSALLTQGADEDWEVFDAMGAPAISFWGNKKQWTRYVRCMFLLTMR